MKHKVLANLYREKAVHPGVMNHHVGCRSLTAAVVKLCGDTFKMLRKSHG